MRIRPADAVLGVSAVAAALAVAYFGFRHGSTYTIGISTRIRDTGRDDLLVALPALWLAIAGVVLLIRRANPDGFRAELRREREELRAARAFSRSSAPR